jgi:hypothetical protein
MIYTKSTEQIPSWQPNTIPLAVHNSSYFVALKKLFPVHKIPHLVPLWG